MSEQTEKNKKQLESIKDKTGEKHNHQKLTINRVPDEAVGKLQDISYELFAGDYGATLAYLTEIHELRNSFQERMEQTEQKVVQLQRHVEQLQEQLENQEDDENGSKVDTIA